jgi:hypothetical protein
MERSRYSLLKQALGTGFQVKLIYRPPFFDKQGNRSESCSHCPTFALKLVGETSDVYLGENGAPIPDTCRKLFKEI